MSVVTNGEIRGYISPVLVESYLKEHYSNVTMSSFKHYVLADDVQENIKNRLEKKYIFADPIFTEDAEFFFNDNGQERRLFMCYFSYADLDDIEELDPEFNQVEIEMKQTETTYFSIGYNGNAVEIMRNLVTSFGGGWLSENDCYGPSYEPI